MNVPGLSYSLHLWVLLTTQDESIVQVSNRIVHHIPTADLAKVEEVRLATSYVSNLVCDKLKRRKVDQVATFLESTKGSHACSVMQGQLFESYVMYRQSEGGEDEYAVKPPEGFLAPAGDSRAFKIAHTEANHLLHLDTCLALMVSWIAVRLFAHWKKYLLVRRPLGVYKAKHAV